MNMIVVSHGANIVKNTYDALRASDILSHLKPDMAVSVKPNLVVSRSPPGGATTHPEVVEGILLFLRDFGISKLKIIESAWVGDNTKKAFKVCGYEALSKKYGVPLIDLKSDSCTILTYGDFPIRICDEALKADFLIDVPVLKPHSKTRMTCCMKNLNGCVPDDQKSRFHELGLPKSIAALNALLQVNYCVVDGICGDLIYEDGGTPVEANRIIAGQSPLAVDAYCAELIGYEPDDIEYLSEGKSMGLSSRYSDDGEVLTINSHKKTLHSAKSDQPNSEYRLMIEEEQACSVCIFALVHALQRIRGKVGTQGKLHIGQGFQGRQGSGMGIGDCASGFSHNVAGCPPRATDIMKALRQS